ncbi:PIN domain-containing protein [Pseudomonas corrugata]|uniref:PIN domain-containing protein n=1 Tax=Pseudomonas corrugata TaxID=47879 RepID=UPI0006D894FD|nr:PIN domain-containing protein [Pseudomonas corrugata]
MPKGMPTAAQLWEGEVSFFSLDTDLIQSAGYNFSEGALKQLPKQLPDTMSLFLSDVVVREIVAHRMVKVMEAVDSFNGASASLKRLTSVPTEGIDALFAGLEVEKAAAQFFREVVEAYAANCGGGGILSVDGDKLAKQMFNLYFAGEPPFAKRKDKKSEFPDAASLLLLEAHAEEAGTMGIVASGDEGWSDFAEESDYLYCVKSIEELAALFAATDEHAQAVEKKIIEAVQTDGASVRQEVTDALAHHVANASWSADNVFSGSVSRVEAEVYEAVLTSYEIESAEVWSLSEDKTTWVIDLVIQATVETAVSVDFYAWDSIDREEVSIGSEPFEASTTIEVQAFLTCSGVQGDSNPDDWQIEIDIAQGSYDCELTDVEPDFGD